MKTLVENFPNQLREALAIGKAAKLTSPKKKISSVYISGLGGSGIGGTIVSELTALEAAAPITVGKGYFIPKFVSENTLVIISSYSGNTEETLNAMEMAIKERPRWFVLLQEEKWQRWPVKRNLT